MGWEKPARSGTLNSAESSRFPGILTDPRQCPTENIMAKPRKTAAQHQGDPARHRSDGAPAMESLGEQLLREAREGHADFVAGWKELVESLGVQGKPIGARKLRELLLQQGIKAENNEFSRGVIAMREE
jgi:hypothetical protein